MMQTQYVYFCRNVYSMFHKNPSIRLVVIKDG
jgi:hypothetical protein